MDVGPLSAAPIAVGLLPEGVVRLGGVAGSRGGGGLVPAEVPPCRQQLRRDWAEEAQAGGVEARKRREGDAHLEEWLGEGGFQGLICPERFPAGGKAKACPRRRACNVV